MSAAVGVARALARPRGAARLVPARLRGALLRGAMGLLLRRRRLDDLLDELASVRRDPAAPRPAGAALPEGPRSTVAALRRLPATCLHRALGAYAALREAGEDARFVIGVRRAGSEVLAHAWIEHRGEPVAEPADPRERFTVAWVHPPLVEPPPRQEEHAMAPPRPSPDVLLTRLADGTGVLLHLGTKFYYTLNRTGVAAWEALSGAGHADRDAIVETLVARFSGADGGRVRADVESLLRELEAEGLLAKGA